MIVIVKILKKILVAKKYSKTFIELFTVYLVW